MTSVAEIADRYVDDFAAHDPIAATGLGIAGYDDQLTDYSPDAADQRAALGRAALARLDGVADPGLSGTVMRERIGAELATHELGEHLRALSVIGSPVSGIRQCFDLMPTESPHDWDVMATRVEAVPRSLESLRAALDQGRAEGLYAAQRQAIACADQAATWGGLEGSTPFFVNLSARYKGTNSALARRLDRASAAATDSYAELARYLRDDYAPSAPNVDPVGEERYAILARNYLGAEVDLREAYAWAWNDLRRITTRMAEVAPRIVPNGSLPEVVEFLEGPEGPGIEGEEPLREWLQDLLDSTIEAMNSTHFDIPERVRTVEAMIAPPGGAAAQYYSPPSEDFGRPGRTWYPTLGKTRFPLWREVSICYHEGVPGHHLQVAQVVHLADRLDRFQRMLAWTSGHGEGWALYAERLMDELGYLDDPAYELGMLSAQALRACRVIVDIGMHLELSIPGDEKYHPGETWRPELALPFLVEYSLVEHDFLASEVDRYLGFPAQAISYKIGERVWLEARADAQQRHADGFDLKAFHSYALDLGNMGLDTLEDQLARF